MRAPRQARLLLHEMWKAHPVKRSDIPDEHVIELAARWKADRDSPGVVRALMAEGIPEKLAVAKVEHMTRHGLLEYGVSPNYAWPAKP